MKISYGIACMRFINNQYEVLLVKKRTSYCFMDFALGKYDIVRKKPKLVSMFNNMRYEEKNIILSMSFKFIYYTAFLKNKIDFTTIEEIKRYNELKNKFKKSFTRKLLQELMLNTNNIKPIWEFPKGRANSKETGKQCAVREFEEETGIAAENYTILDIKPIITTVNNNNFYKQIIYIAFMNNYIEKKYIGSADFETSEIAWFSSNKINLLFNPTFSNLFKKIKKIIKNNKNKKDVNKRKIKGDNRESPHRN